MKLFTILASFPALAGTMFVEDFNGPSLDPNLLLATPPGWNFSLASGAGTFSTSANSTAGATITLPVAISPFSDLDVTVDVTRDPGAPPLHLGVILVGTGPPFTTLYQRFLSGGTLNYNYGPAFGNIPFANNQATFRISYSGGANGSTILYLRHWRRVPGT